MSHQPADKEANAQASSAAARRALAEAEARRAIARPLDLPRELGGRSGPEPIRHGDWELRGIASDF